MTIIDSPGQAAPAEWFTGALMVWHITSEQSGGAFALGEMWVRPGTEPPLHIHALRTRPTTCSRARSRSSSASTGSRRRRAPSSSCRAASSMGSRCGRRLRGCCTSTRPVGRRSVPVAQSDGTGPRAAPGAERPTVRRRGRGVDGDIRRLRRRVRRAAALGVALKPGSFDRGSRPGRGPRRQRATSTNPCSTDSVNTAVVAFPPASTVGV